MTSLLAKAFNARFRLLAQEGRDAPLSLDDERLKLANAGSETQLPSNVSFTRGEVAGLPGVWVEPADCQRRFCGLFIHGGAFVMMSAETHQRLAGHFCAASGARAFVLDYALAPEHPFPAALMQTRSCLEALVREQETFLFADSAGAALALGAVQECRDAGGRLPFALGLMSPWLDLTLRSESVAELADMDPMLKADVLARWAALYAGGHDLNHPRVSPLFGAMAGLPPTMIQTAALDILRDDGARLRDAISMSGGDVRYQCFEGMMHSFQFYAGHFPEAREALDKLAQFAEEQFQALSVKRS